MCVCVCMVCCSVVQCIACLYEGVVVRHDNLPFYLKVIQ